MEEDMEPAVKFASSCSFCCHDGQWTLCEFVCSCDGGCVLSLGFHAFELVSKSMSCLWQFAVFASLKSGLILQEHVVRSVALEGVLVIMRNSSVPLLFTFSHTCYFNRYSLSAWWGKVVVYSELIHENCANQTFSLVVTWELYNCIYLHITCVFSSSTTRRRRKCQSYMSRSYQWIFLCLGLCISFLLQQYLRCSSLSIFCLPFPLVLLSWSNVVFFSYFPFMRVLPVEGRSVLLFAVIQNSMVFFFFLPKSVSWCYPFLWLSFILSLF